ncbi:MAG: class I adenylate-forming enzyme family protein [Acutalibacteraceae bacterium]|nr:class I adenylate-forming enzyme family protein [Acutalibacteraceae bacterium]
MKFPPINKTPVIHPYPMTTMFGAIELSAKRVPDAPALLFEGKYTTYRQFVERIEQTAKAFLKYGIKKGDAVTICMPNTPQGVICLYALNRIGAVANMVHPLSSQKNITFYLDYSESKMILTLAQFYDKVRTAADEAENDVTVLVARIRDELPFPKNILFRAVKNKENINIPEGKNDLIFSEFVKNTDGVTLPEVEFDMNKTAVILYSGGTSGTPKGIMLSDYNFNALGMQVAEISGCNLDYGCKFLSVMPIFHGFGLGIGIHTVLENGAMCILIPQFTKETYAKAVLKHKPNFIAGVPTLYEALLKVDIFNGADLSFLIGVFSGGDSLSPELKKRADKFLKEHNASVQIREGYGLTECVTASCVTPHDRAKEGSIGLPLRDMIYKVVEPGTFNELPRGERGEIIITGPTLMLGYMKAPEENAKTLKVDENGTTWMFSGDMGTMDEEGFIYFKQRIKRLIVTSGYNVYPTHIENILDKHESVDYSCVIGVRDPYKMQRVRAYIVLKEGFEATEETKQQILDYCKTYLDVFERPKEIIFKTELPKTLVGKVAYHSLEEEAEKELLEKETATV